MKSFRRGVLLCLLLAATAGCDRVTKHLAVTALAGTPGQSYLGDTVRLLYHENPGGFLSAGATWRPEVRAVVFQAANGLFLLGTILLATRFQWSRWGKAGLIMFIATGRVIDFLNVGVGPIRTGIFNVADVAIMVGIGLLLWESRRNSLHPDSSNSTPSEELGSHA
jgi:signal peptidase II